MRTPALCLGIVLATLTTLADGPGESKGPGALKLLTPARIAHLPDAERTAWQAYLDRSRGRAIRERATLAEEVKASGLDASRPAPSDGAQFAAPSKTDTAWFAGPEAGKLADAILSYQTPSGGWSKAVDYRQGPRRPGTHWTTQGGAGWHYCGTLDNRSTTEQIRFLALVHRATGREDCREGASRGVGWLLEAQFPNGGWPQVYPLEPGYHEAITLNDNAMLHALEVLHDVAASKEPFSFADAPTGKKAADAFDAGIACLLRCQVRVDGRPTVWCAQHDPLTLEPAAARLKEPPSLSGAESASLLKFLMRQGPLTPATRDAIEAGVAWLEAHQIAGLRKTKDADGKTDYVEDPASTEVYWARFYDPKTAVPLFAGGQDGIIYPTFREMARRNKVTYEYYTTQPRDIIGKEYDRWKKRRE